MSGVKIVRKSNGEAKKNQNGQYILTKDGVYFALSKAQMDELGELMRGILDGILEKVAPDTDDVVVED